MVECRECSARNSDSSTFCVRCGAPLVQVSAAATPGSDTDRLDPVTVEAAPVEAAPDPEALLGEAVDLMGNRRPEEAAAKCREAIRLAPEMVAADSMLGMAEEQRGNTMAAAGAYRRVLQIDPSRSAEREKLELLYAGDQAHEPAPTRGGQGESGSWTHWAPLVAGLGGALLVMVILAAVIVNVYSGRVLGNAYKQSMVSAEASLERRDYTGAVKAFEAALAARPDDNEATDGLAYAQRKLQAARSSVSAGSLTQRPALAPIVPSRGTNPFQPIPVGPQPDARRDPREQAQTPSRPRSNPPPVVDRNETVRGTRVTPPTTDDGAVPFQNPLDDPGDDGGTPAADIGPPTATTDTESTPPRGEISIWISEAPPRTRDGGTGGSTSPASTGSHASSAASLRKQADQLRDAGDCEGASAAYERAIGEYQADTERNPGVREANDASIKSCERARNLCESAQGQ